MKCLFLKPKCWFLSKLHNKILCTHSCIHFCKNNNLVPRTSLRMHLARTNKIVVRFHFHLQTCCLLFFFAIKFHGLYFLIHILLWKLGNLHLSFGKKGTFFALGTGPNIGPRFRESRALLKLVGCWFIIH